MNKAQLFWDKQAKKFDANEKQFEQSNRELIARTKEYLNSNDIVLDFGCATGTKTIELSYAIKHIHGLDISEEMISEAIKKKNEENCKNVSFSQGMIFDDDMEKASFDKIIAFAIIHLIEESENVIQRIYELLKPGGLFISATPCFKEKMNTGTRLQITVYRFMKQLGIFPLHLNMFKISDLEKLLIRKNFKIVIAENKFLNGMTICFIVAKKT